MIEELIAIGHRPADVWEYSPREIAGYLVLAGERRKSEASEQLAIATMAARSDPKEIKKLLDKMARS
ncbi:hypothetical protein [Mesorhizobium sp. M7A.F.Ce.TU.012.03.2.1]|uniref:hypothetical protein n=1 Tax=Mesorhizobium sp. M7A.F.Ce.TU.012.03.2.1 TaxID=2493681 RepID=UPI000FDB3436|nr:hypothetical protein [Mesorhizobium sp. M7A.F.Ce.TU.012.03.2.1]AZV21476.1 hypothetical protein EJ079_21780 [Mesorhizobium sp. M7A.F.Ce.TU.012.03.2.1]